MTPSVLVEVGKEGIFPAAFAASYAFTQMGKGSGPTLDHAELSIST